MKSAFKDAGAKAAPAGAQGAQPAPPAARSEEASIRELVESCLVNDDFTPVVRAGTYVRGRTLATLGDFVANPDTVRTTL